MSFKVGSLFAGVGGICLGFEQAKIDNDPEHRYELIWANEIDPYPAITYKHNFNHKLIVGDIEKIVDIDRCLDENEKNSYIEKRNLILETEIDILTGGFPCQAFSIAGDRKGFDDHRGNLFWSIIDLVNLHYIKFNKKPRVLLLENVKNLMSHDNGNTYLVIKKELEKIGYIVKEAILNTMLYTDIPQNRERIFITCFLNEKDANRFTFFDKDKKGNYLNLHKYIKNYNKESRLNQIKNLLDNLNINEKNYYKYYYTPRKYPHYFVTEEKYNKIPENERKNIRINLSESINEENQFYQLRRGMYVRKNQNNVCPTLTANMGTGGHNCPLIFTKNSIRKITPSEAFKLQGFPIGSRYSITDSTGKYISSDGRLYKQAGNAVSVPIIKLIAEEILKSLID